MIYNTDPKFVSSLYAAVVKALGTQAVAAEFKPRETKSGAFIFSNTENAMNAPLCRVTLENGDKVSLKLSVINYTPAAQVKQDADLRAKVLAINPTATPEQVAQAVRALTGKR